MAARSRPTRSRFGGGPNAALQALITEPGKRAFLLNSMPLVAAARAFGLTVETSDFTHRPACRCSSISWYRYFPIFRRHWGHLTTPGSSSCINTPHPGRNPSPFEAIAWLAEAELFRSLTLLMKHEYSRLAMYFDNSISPRSQRNTSRRSFSLSGHPKPTNEGHLKTGQRE